MKLIAQVDTAKTLLSRNTEPSYAISNSMFFSLHRLLYSLKGDEKALVSCIFELIYKFHNCVKIKSQLC